MTYAKGNKIKTQAFSLSTLKRNLFAWQFVGDDAEHTGYWNFAIPHILDVTFRVRLPKSKWVQKLCGGKGKRARYGFIHDFDVTAFDWCKAIDSPSQDHGHEISCKHAHGDPSTVVKVTNLTGCVEHVDALDTLQAYMIHKVPGHSGLRWEILLKTHFAKSTRWYFPNQLDYCFELIVHATDDMGHPMLAKARIPYDRTRYNDMSDVLHCLVDQVIAG